MSTLTKPSSAATRPAAGTAPDVEIPLVDWGNLALRAGRTGPVLPHMAWRLRFGESIDEATLTAEVQRLAATPYGLGRRIVAPRLPGGRHRWRQERQPPPVNLRPDPLKGADAEAAWLDRELGVPLDPEHDAGWRMSAAPTADGGTLVLIVVHHLFGTGGGIVNALYGDDDVDPAVGTTQTRFSPENDFTVWREARAIGERFGLGLQATAQLARSIPAAWAGRRRDADGTVDPRDPRPVQASRGRDRTRRPPSNLRVAAIATMPAAAWDTCAAEHGGSGTTLLAAVCANLLRRARIARGGSPDRTLRLLLPIDLTDRDVARVAQRTSGPSMELTTAEVVLEGGPPVHRELATLRARMKAAFIRDSAQAPTVRGAGDVMRLLPEALTFRAAAQAALRIDGCASNVGAIPPGMLRLGPHIADDLAMLGFPIGNETLTGLARYRDQVAVTVMTDPVRLGPAADLRSWFAEELAGWGLDEVVG
ncbi:MAG: hypothetical protein WBQ18_02695 [Solirubrobacteraceae bacterium]